MTEITVQAVKSLRERTGAGMMECKRALIETGGDEEQAIDLLRQKGAAKAAARSHRSATEGAVAAVQSDAGTVAMVAVSSETDFVARNDVFRSFVAQVADAVADADLESGRVYSGEDLLARPELADLEQNLTDLRSSIGENLQIRSGVRYVSAEESATGSYVHFGDKIGVVVELAGTEPTDAARELARDVAMHVAAANPLGVRPEDIPEEQRERERAILVEQAKGEGKPDAIAEKIVEGRMRKYFEQSTLTEQAFVKDPDIKVGALVEQRAPGAQIKGFTRFEVG
ncbi:MAG: translation elongation factor Ts [Gemmatimonadota bacterium]